MLSQASTVSNGGHATPSRSRRNSMVRAPTQSTYSTNYSSWTPHTASRRQRRWTMITFGQTRCLRIRRPSQNMNTPTKSTNAPDDIPPPIPHAPLPHPPLTAHLTNKPHALPPPLWPPLPTAHGLPQRPGGMPVPFGRGGGAGGGGRERERERDGGRGQGWCGCGCGRGRGSEEERGGSGGGVRVVVRVHCRMIERGMLSFLSFSFFGGRLFCC
ncbi:hypothetical protein K439DRAFT_1148411 [Ramaria rubella]|nr:hypothetical protein K439DRAFT_1148411 [Ramaria rubella]